MYKELLNITQANEHRHQESKDFWQRATSVKDSMQNLNSDGTIVSLSRTPVFDCGLSYA